MALKIRLRQQGRNNRQTYRVVVTDIRNKRDGKYLEKLGWYDPFLAEKNVQVNEERMLYWLEQGAEITHDVQRLVLKSAPHVIKQWNEKRAAQRTKKTAKRRALRRAKRAEAAPRVAAKK